MIVSAGALTTGLSGRFTDTYTKRGPVYDWLNLIVETVPSDSDTENHAAPESVGGFVRKDRGSSISVEGIKFYAWSTKNLDFEKGIKWHRNDRMDDKTGKLYRQAQSLGGRYAELNEEVIIGQGCNGTTNLELLDGGYPNAPDGLGVFSSSTRFGNSSGNIRSGSGVASSAAIVTDIFAQWSDYCDVRDTKSRNYFPIGALKRFLIVFKPSNMQVFAEAVLQEIRAQAVTTATSNAGVSNILQSAKFEILLAPSNYITNNDWYMFALDVGNKPFYVQEREALREIPATEENDSEAMRTGDESLFFKLRRGYGADVPLCARKTDN